MSNSATENTHDTVEEHSASLELSDEILRLELDKFEGPFEVLLYLIKTQEVDIFDIPILQVTRQYLQFLDMMSMENLDIAGEFLVMAATLIQIKSKMILPLDTVEDEEEFEEEDPRIELVEKLLEYRKFRDLATAFGDQQELHADRIPRKAKPKIEAAEEDEEEGYLEVSLYDLIKAIRGIFRFVFEANPHEVYAEGASVDDKIAYIHDYLTENESITWTELFHSCKSKVEMVCCLLAILELCHMKRIRAHQHGWFGEIRLFLKTDEDNTEQPLPSGEAHVDMAKNN